MKITRSVAKLAALQLENGRLQKQLAQVIRERNGAERACRSILDTIYMKGPSYDKCVAVVAKADARKEARHA